MSRCQKRRFDRLGAMIALSVASRKDRYELRIYRCEKTGKEVRVRASGSVSPGAIACPHCERGTV